MQRLIGLGYLLIGISILILMTGSRAGEVIMVTAEVDKSVITIGDRITYSLLIEHEKDLKVEQPGPGANLGQFEIKDYKIHEPRELEGMIQQQFDYEISVFDTGRFIIPPFPVAFAETDTSREYQIIESSPLEIYVKSVLTAGDQELRDIKPPQNVPFDYQAWIIIGLVGIIILSLFGFFFYYIRAKRQGKSLFRKEIVRPAHEIALEQLQMLMGSWKHLLMNGEHKKIFTQISQILRLYLENRYFIKALEETTVEISQSVQQLEMDDHLLQTIINVLEFSDLVKFAKYVPTEKETSDIFDKSIGFIQATQLVYEQEETDDESGSENKPKEIEPELKVEQ
jgi:hypothetical protein